MFKLFLKKDYSVINVCDMPSIDGIFPITMLMIFRILREKGSTLDLLVNEGRGLDFPNSLSLLVLTSIFHKYR